MTGRGRASLAGAWLFAAALWSGMLAFFGVFGARTVLLTSPSRHAVCGGRPVAPVELGATRLRAWPGCAAPRTP